jgi:hypothetical protein
MVLKKLLNFPIVPPIIFMICYEAIFLVSELMKRMADFSFVEYTIIPFSGLPMLITYKVGGIVWIERWWIIHIFQFALFLIFWFVFINLKKWYKVALVIFLVAINTASFFFLIK